MLITSRLPLACSLLCHFFPQLGSHVALFSRALSVISTIPFSHLPRYLRDGIASISPCVRYSPRYRYIDLGSLHRHSSGITPLYSLTCNFDVLCNLISISMCLYRTTSISSVRRGEYTLIVHPQKDIEYSHASNPSVLSPNPILQQ